MRLLATIAANALALLATTVVSGIRFRGGVFTLVAAGALFAIFNAVVRPVAVFLSIPFLVVTLGLFYLVLNGLLLWVASWFLPGYSVSGLLSGILGSVVIAVVNWALAALFRRKETAERR